MDHNEDPNEYLDDGIDPAADEQETEHRGLVAAISGWSSSLLVHALLVALLTSIMLFQEEEREPLPVITINAQDLLPTPPPPPPVPMLPVESKHPIETAVVDPVDSPAPTTLELPAVEPEIENDPSPEDPVQVAEAYSPVEAFLTPAPAVIGLGSPRGKSGDGPFSRRKVRGGPSGDGHGDGIPAARVRAVDRALLWFKRHQSPDGSWDVDGYPDNCTDRMKCEPGTVHTDTDGGDVACTGYALLCFLGSGYEHCNPSRYRTTVESGLRWLRERSVEGEGGIILSKNIYAQAVAAKAVVEAYGMTGDVRLRDFAQGVTDRLVALQNRDADGYGLGWNYHPSPTRNDASVSGWVIMTLKSAAASGLDVGNSLQGAKTYLSRAWQAMNPNWQALGSGDLSGFPYSWDPVSGKAERDALAPAGALCAIFLGAKKGDLMLETLCNYVERKQTPQAYPCNTYFTYYNTFAMFQAGGERWKRWNDQVMPLLQEAQRRDVGCFDGSWDWEGTQFPGHDTGRLLSTAYNCLCLQVQWMYDLVEG